MGETNRRERVIEDAKAIDKVMCNYSGEDRAHFGFIVYETGERRFFLGGKADLVGMCIGEAMATMVHNTPGMDENYIDEVAETAKMLLSRMEKVQIQ